MYKINPNQVLLCLNNLPPIWNMPECKSQTCLDAVENGEAVREAEHHGARIVEVGVTSTLHEPEVVEEHEQRR